MFKCTVLIWCWFFVVGTPTKLSVLKRVYNYACKIILIFFLKHGYRKFVREVPLYGMCKRVEFFEVTPTFSSYIVG